MSRSLRTSASRLPGTTAGILALLAAAGACSPRTERPPASRREAATTAPRRPAADAAPPSADAAAPRLEATPAPAAPATAPRVFPTPEPGDRPGADPLRSDLLNDWMAADATRPYGPDDLHLLVDGGDEVFLRYGAAWAVRRSYRTERPSNRRLRIELFAFSSPDGADGRYAHERPATDIDPPPPAELAGRVRRARLEADQLTLTRGRCLAFVRYEDDAESDAAKLIEAARLPLLAMGAALADALDDDCGTEAEP